LPPGKASNTQQLGPVKKHICTTHPGDLIAHHRGSARHQLLLQVERIGRIVDQVPIPRERFGCEWLWFDWSAPQLDVLLLRPLIMQVAGTSSGTAHKAAAFLT